MDASTLMKRVEALRLHAMDQLRALNTQHEGSPTKLEVAGLVHDVLFVAFTFGYIPPLRATSVLLTLTMPPHVGCVHPDCQHKASGCLGNRVYRHPVTGEDLSKTIVCVSVYVCLTACIFQHQTITDMCKQHQTIPNKSVFAMLYTHIQQ